MEILKFLTIKKCRTIIFVKIPREHFAMRHNTFKAHHSRLWSAESSLGEQRRFLLEIIGAKIGIRQPNDWQYVTLEEINRVGGLNLLNGFYSRSLSEALERLAPELTWKPWRFISNMFDVCFWKIPVNRRHFLEELKDEYQLGEPPANWHRLKPLLALELAKKRPRRISSVVEIPRDQRRLPSLLETLAALLRKFYGNSLRKALISVFGACCQGPNERCFDYVEVSRGHWKSKRNQRRFFDWLSVQLHLETLGHEDGEVTDRWYTLRHAEVCRFGGGALLSDYYRNSLSRALCQIYSEKSWQPWRFEPLPHHFLSDRIEQRRYFQWLADPQRLNVQRAFDWAAVIRTVEANQTSRRTLARTSDDLAALLLRLRGFLLRRFDGSLAQALAHLFPEQNPETWFFSRSFASLLETSCPSTALSGVARRGTPNQG